LEENAEIVIENQGAWFQKLHPSLQTSYGSFGAQGYIICFVIELLRFCRNVIAHAGQNPEIMEQALGTGEPSNEQIFYYFSTRWPLFYLHILYVLKKATQSTAAFENDVYLKEYKRYENAQSQLKQDSGDLVPLQKTNLIEVQFEDKPEKVTLSIKPEKINQPYSIIPGQLVIEAVEKESNRIWPDTPFQFISLKDNKGHTIQSASTILEGSIITVRKQNLTIRISQILVDPMNPAESPKPLEFEIEFTSKTNVRAIKGHTIKKILDHLKIKVDAKKIKVMLKGTTLNLTQNLASIGWEEGDILEATYGDFENITRL
jgi:uncharacterized ubiquitin-like protein YukD